MHIRRLVPFVLLAACTPSLVARNDAGAGLATSSALSAADLRTRLFAIAHDSMMGRAPGDAGNYKATAYIASEFARLGLRPAGDDGGWFQVVPFWRRTADRRDTIRVDGYAAKLGTDYAPSPGNARSRDIDGRQVVYAGLASDPSTWIDAATAQGKALLFSVIPVSQRTVATRRTDLNAVRLAPRFAGAATIFVSELDAAGASSAAAYLTGNLVLDTTWRDVPTMALVTNAFAARLLGRALDEATPGTLGRTLRGAMRVGVFPLEFTARNVVAVLPGSDPGVNGQFVSLTSHNDHVGFDHNPVDHDSLRAFNAVVRPMGADSPARDATPEEARRVKQILDSLRAIRPTARPDSIRNGADDDGTGTVALLEIAELLSHGPRLRRSILFVSHTAEEFGLLGSRWFTDHPTVARDSIIGEIDMDMIGRGSVHDLPDAGPTYLEAIGLRRLSTEFGDVLAAANAKQPQPFVFNMTFDAPNHPLQYYCRADHYSYARYGIPAAVFSRGEHMDYHQVTDEAQYIDYDALARVATFVKDAAISLATRADRPRLDKPKTDPNAPCRQ
ncbi:MAG: M28 family peptidase [Gemmatimonadaceae bacterium]|nr:M28 family peptidase [Gemmatimonadaceae bacterium]